ncbi:MauE/DoxX family redox-associated membrane protein [Herbidospora cretacea]|uniref:MauE/DoxX family redox-associated membrane protein n=1 Tax=Herbidospora cretacea TaxID=28444 RepID=UPI001E2B3D9E|nr:MauE/DoxX family redox-associated membrane protein [Herbidospora cretacea]
MIFSGTALVIVFLASGLGKLRRPAEFAGSIRAMRLLPAAAAPAAAILIIAGELAAALALLAGLTVDATPLVYAFALSAALCVVFSLAIITVIRRGASVACACFGRRASAFSARHVVRNILLAALAIAGLLGADTGAASWTPETAITIAAGAALSLLVILMDDLADLFA